MAPAPALCSLAMRARAYVTDLQHFLDEEGRLVSGGPGKLGAYLACVAELGSLLPLGAAGTTGARCALPGQRACGAPLWLHRQAHDTLAWECGACGARGVIRGWAGTRFDLSGVAAAGGDDEGDVILPHDEWLAARRRVECAPALRLRLAAILDVDGGFVAFTADYGEMLELVRRSREAADAARGKDRRLLDRFSAFVEGASTHRSGFTDPVLDLADALELGASEEVFEHARRSARTAGRDVVRESDLVDAQLALAARRGGHTLH